jgi:hypothetical protein
MTDRLLQLQDPSVDKIDSMEAGVERLPLGGVLEPPYAEPLAPHDGPGAGRQETPRDADRTSTATADRASGLGARPRRASTSSTGRFRLDSSKVGELLFRATPATHDRSVGADHSLPTT